MRWKTSLRGVLGSKKIPWR